jgi:uncharacterized membrane protein
MHQLRLLEMRLRPRQGYRLEQIASSRQQNFAKANLLIRKMTTDKVLADLEGAGGAVIRTSFDHTKEQALRDALAGHAALEQAADPAP